MKHAGYAVETEEVLGAVFGETDVYGIDKRQDNKDAKTDKSRKEVPEGFR